MFEKAENMRNAEDEFGFHVDPTARIIDSCRAGSDTLYFQVANDKDSLWIPRSSCFPDPNEAIARLKKARIEIMGPDNRNSILKEAIAINRFPPRLIIEHSGHYENCFGYNDGRVFTPDSLRNAKKRGLSPDHKNVEMIDQFETPPIAYTKGLLCVQARGTLEEWKRDVVGLVEGQHLPIFAILMALAAPLISLTNLSGNYLIMYVGPPRKGKSTTIAVAASVCGPSTDSVPGQRYLRKFNQTMNRIEEKLPLYRDMPMIIDDLSSFGTMKTRAETLRTLVHNIYDGDGRERFGDPLDTGSHVRTIGQFTANDTASAMLRHESGDAVAAVVDRLIEIPVPRGDEGVFNKSNPDFDDTEALAIEVSDRLNNYHGTAMPAFLQHLMAHRQERGDLLQSDFRTRMNEFALLPAVLDFGPISSRVLALFGLASLAGRLGKRYGVIPDAIDCDAAVVHCLSLHLGRRVEISPAQQLLGWLASNRAHDLRSGRLPALSSDSLRRRGAFIEEGTSGTQFWMHPSLFRTSFDSPHELKRRLHADGILLSDGNGRSRHYAIKRQLRRNEPPERVMVFQLPDFEEWLEANGYPRPARRRR